MTAKNCIFSKPFSLKDSFCRFFNVVCNVSIYKWRADVMPAFNNIVWLNDLWVDCHPPPPSLALIVTLKVLLWAFVVISLLTAKKVRNTFSTLLLRVLLREKKVPFCLLMTLIHNNKKVDMFRFRPSFRKAGNKKIVGNINMNFILLESEKYLDCKTVVYFAYVRHTSETPQGTRR